MALPTSNYQVNMNTYELEKKCKSIPITSAHILGVFPADRLPEPKPCTAFICNTKSLGDKGEHWVAIAWDEKCMGNYFCSFGEPPPPEILSYFTDNGHQWQRTKRQTQHILSDLCGQYCIVFLYFFCNKYTMAEFMSEVLWRKEQTDTFICNDKFVKNLYSLVGK